MRSTVLAALAALSLSLSLAAPAFAEPTVDLVPQSLSFSRVLDDDVSGTYSQYVSIPIRNQGNVTWSNRTNHSIRVRLGSREVDGLIYGPVQTYFQLGAPIAPGKVGRIHLRLPLNTLRHCDRLRVQIDTLRRQQSGYASVFANDAITVFAIDPSNIRACVLPPRPIDDLVTR